MRQAHQLVGVDLVQRVAAGCGQHQAGRAVRLQERAVPVARVLPQTRERRSEQRVDKLLEDALIKLSWWSVTRSGSRVGDDGRVDRR